MPANSRPQRAFAAYLELGPARSLARLAQALREDASRAGFRRAPSLRTLELWSTTYRWQERLEEMATAADQELQRQRVDWVKQHRERLRQEGLLLQQRGLEWLKDKQPDNVRAHEAIRAIEAGFKLEALALGEATDRIALEEHDERLQRLSDEELTLIIEQARLAQRGGPADEGEALPG